MSAEPSAEEQLMVELINRARADPQGEFDELIVSTNPVIGVESGITSALRFFNVDLNLFAQQLASASPAAPLAWNESLGTSSTTHSQLMIDFDDQSHNLPGEPGLGQRFRDAGYTGFQLIGENIFAFTQSVVHGHAGFYIDWGFEPGGIQDPPGHRNAILNPTYDEIGIGILEQTDPNADVGPLVVTQHFGTRFGTDPKLTGVIIDDQDDDDFYDIGEGLGGVNVSAVGATGTFSTVSYASGGYNLELPTGSYVVTYSGGGLGGTVTENVAIGTVNVKVDVELDDVVAGQTITGGPDDDFLPGSDGADVISGLGGDDFLFGGAANDQLFGGEGSDVLEGNAGSDTLDGGTGDDFISLLGADAPVTLNLADMSQSSPDYVNDVLISIEGVLGVQAFANTIIGDDAANILLGGRQADSMNGGGGDDVLFSLDGDDTLVGGAGVDVFLSGAGADRMTGGADVDVFLFRNEEQDVITDFSIAAGDLLAFFGQVGSFLELSFSTDTSGDAVIGYGPGSAVTLEGVTEAEINPTPGTAPAWIFIA